MKKVILMFCMMGSIGHAVAQSCTPDVSITEPGMYPSTTTNLPYAYMGVPYSTSVQFKVLTDTVISGTYVTVTDVTLDSVSGMPPGFAFTSNPANRVFPGGSNACASLFGNPQAGQGGTYHLVVHLTVRGIAFGFIHVTQAQTVTGYKIVINSPPFAHFTGTPTAICEGESVVFANTSTGHPTAWTWSFPGGTPSSSNLQIPPPIVYQTSGIQNVTLTVYSPAGSDVTNINNYITVNNGPAASVTPSGNINVCQGSTVALSANTGGGLT
ncbi:MAG: PKD domain-containing protein, partial [Bacteroidota bacterium]